MSTFPGRIKLKPQLSKINGVGFELNASEPAGPLLTRPTSESRFNLESQLEFDAGLNSSAAWTEHINVAHDQAVKSADDNLSISLSDKGLDKATIPKNNLREEGQENEDASGLQETGIFGPGRLARVLYDFDGESSAQELNLHAGEEIEIVQETIEGAEGWSLARISVRLGQGVRNDRAGEVQSKAEEENGEENLEEIGLVPREYYIFTTEFLASPSEEQLTSSPSHEREASTPRPSALTITSSGIVTAKTNNPSLIPQNTGEWFKQQMRSMILGGRSLNRFSRFVTSGAEAFILRGPVISSHTSTSDDPESTYKSNQNEESMSTNAKDGLPRPTSTRLSTYLSSSSGLVAGHAREPTLLPTEALPDTHYIDVDEAGPTWREKVPSFEVHVHSPEKQYTDPGSGSVGMGGSAEAGAYIVYSITSVFSPPPSLSDSNEKSDGESSSFSAASAFAYSITVHRRFSHFVLLHRTLSSSLPALALSPLPQKQFSGRLNSEFVEARRRELERWLKSVVSHPVMRYVEPVRFFLGCEDEVEFRRQLPNILNPSHPSQSSTEVGRRFFSNVYHPPFQIDLEDSTLTASRFQNHIKAVSRGVQHFRHQGTFGEVRKARVEMSRAERLLSYEILGLITSRRLPGTSSDEEDEEEQTAASPQSPIKHDGRSRRSRRLDEGLQNSDGAWCWREDCSDCLRLTKCMQKTAETLQGVADLYDSHARRTMFETEDSLKDTAHADSIYAPILDIHKQTLERYKETSLNNNGDRNNSSDKPSDVTANGTDRVNGLPESRVEIEQQDEDSVATRCETVLNTTLSEFDAYHSQKVDGFEKIVKGHLDGEIAFYEKVLSRLRTTRALFDASPTELQLTMPGPRQPSIYERDFLQTSGGNGAIPMSVIVSEPLPRPAPHVLDSKNPSSMMTRPVSDAIHGLLSFAGVNGGGVNDTREEGEGVGRRNEEEERGSMFSRLW